MPPTNDDRPAKKAVVANLGKLGIDLVSSPLHMEDGSLESAQNCKMGPIELEDGLAKRDGMRLLNVAAAASGILGFIWIPISDVAPTDGSDGWGKEDPVATAVRTSAYMSGNTLIANNTPTAVVLDVENFDVGNCHDPVTNPSRFTVPAAQAGCYLVIGQLAWQDNTQTAHKRALIYKNGAAVAEAVDWLNSTTGYCFNCVHALLELAVGDYVELYALQHGMSTSYYIIGGARYTWLAFIQLALT